MRAFPLVQVDVFTERVFGGNPLAVVFDAASLDTAEMQAIAREMNLSETTFILPATQPDCVARVRIFTPTLELPFAGHPTIGTTWVLASRGELPAGARQLRLEEGIGPVPVILEGDLAAPAFVWMHHRDPHFGPPFADRAAIAGALSLSAADLLPNAPLCTGSTGVEFLYVPLRSPDLVDSASLDVPALLRALGPSSGASVFIFALHPDLDGTNGGGRRVYARMFAPHTVGVAEDPATSSASGPLAAFLVQHGLIRIPVGEGGRARIISEQGTRMGRQSFIHMDVRLPESGGRATDIRVGGSVVPVMEGTLRLP